MVRREAVKGVASSIGVHGSPGEVPTAVHGLIHGSVVTTVRGGLVVGDRQVGLMCEWDGGCFEKNYMKTRVRAARTPCAGTSN